MPNLFDNAGAGAAVEDEAEEVEVDLDATVEAEKPDADVNAAIPQPPAGKYLLRAKLLDRGEIANPKPGQTKEKKPFITVGLDLEIVDEGGEFHGFRLQEYLTSLVQKQRGTSALHHFMNCIGEQLPQSISLRDLIDRVRTALDPEDGQSPMVQAEIEWKASRKVGPGKNDYEQVAKFMRDFPKRKDGDGYSQTYIWKDPKNPSRKMELNAFAYVSKFLQQ